MIHDYLIAGHRIRVEGERLVQAVDALTGFIPFKVMADGEPLCHFVESTTEAPLFETVLYTNEIMVLSAILAGIIMAFSS